LKVNKEKTGPCEYVLTIEVEPEYLQEPLRQAARRLSKRRPLPGFRPGKAPYHIVERMYGKESIIHEMLEQIGNKLYQEALQQSKLEPYDSAALDIVQLEPLILKATVPVQPQVTLGDYHKIRVKQKSVRVRKAEVEQVLAKIQEDNALWVPVERPVQMGDQVTIDAISTSDDGTEIKHQDLNVVISEEMVPPQFGQNLVGIKPGDSTEFDAEYPADFGDEKLAGKHIHFHITVKSVKEKELPALDDELAQTVGAETLAKLRAQIKEDLRTRKEAEAKDEALDKALEALVEQSTLEYPAIAVEHEIDAMVESFANRLKQQGFTLEGYLSMLKKPFAQWREEIRPQAEARLKRALVLAQFAEAEGIKVEAEEIAQEVDRLSLPFGDQADAVKATLSTGQPLRSITNDVYRRKALDHLLAIATGHTKSTEKKKDKAEHNKE